ncbi:hypothetical protein [Xanthobacter sp. YC-JY1]|uniref:hypothetical protein n=1 Tax=Xanthobacter sp. YC-JY1 TaxID=2419844 RepID=UPI001F24103A|nr:hypothetical protein [Xanthobacter sp. YC-JY1]
MVWSDWGGAARCPVSYSSFGDTSLGIRQVELEDGRRLRLFFLSILWRCVETSKNEFSHIHLDKDRTNGLRRIICGIEDYDVQFLPLSLLQISSAGEQHNYIHSNEFIKTPKINEDNSIDVISMPAIRVYFDGLVYNFYIGDNVDGADDELIFLHGSQMIVPTVESLGSIQFARHDADLVAAQTGYPDEFRRIKQAISKNPK